LPEVFVDVERMAQVLGNLIENALRFTPAGGAIQLSASAAGDEARLEVGDTGSGIPADYLPHIFERSYLGDKARQGAEGESGLGLSIAKSLVEAQGGTISVQSEVGTGTTFTIHLPVKR
jgi:signal transduction histidine kinase